MAASEPSSDQTRESRTIRIPALLQSLADAMTFLGTASTELALSPRVTHQLQLAAEEAFVNIVQHSAGATGGGAVTTALTLRVESDRCVLLVQDDGKPFDPTQLPLADVRASLTERKPGGLGVHLIRTLMDGVRYTSENGLNTLTLTKRL